MEYAGVIWLALWFLVNIVLTLLTKILMVTYSFKYPVTMSFVHQALTAFLSFLENLINSKDTEPETPEKEQKSFKHVILLSILFALNIVFGNLSLYYCSVAFVQVVKSIVPITTMILSWTILHETFSIKTILSCVVICFGVALTCFSDTKLTITGLIVTLTTCFLSSLKKIFTKIVLSGENKISPQKLLISISPFSAIEIFLISLYRNEHISMIDPSSQYKKSFLCIFGVVLSGIIAYFLNLTNFYATKFASPLTMTIAGCLKQVITIFLSFLLFSSSISTLNRIGMCITIVGSLWYSLLEVKNSDKEDKNEITEDVLMTISDGKEQLFKIINEKVV